MSSCRSLVSTTSFTWHNSSHSLPGLLPLPEATSFGLNFKPQGHNQPIDSQPDQFCALHLLVSTTTLLRLFALLASWDRHWWCNCLWFTQLDNERVAWKDSFWHSCLEHFSFCCVEINHCTRVSTLRNNDSVTHHLQEGMEASQELRFELLEPK